LSDEKRTEGTLIAAILFCLVLQTWLALVMEINWDEFFYLSHIYAYQHGELTKALQSFHVHFFGWLTRIPGDEIDQIVAGRFVMFLCEAGTCALIYLLSRPFVSRRAALISSLSFASAGFTIVHGASFRADPIALLFMLAALLVIARGRPTAISMLGAAGLAAVGAMVTVKVVLYAPAFLGVASWRIASAPDRRKVFLWLAGASAASAAAFAVLYMVQLGLIPKATNASSNASLGNAAETQFGAGFLPRLRELTQFFLLSPLQVLLLVVGAAASLSIQRRRDDRLEAIALLGCGATLLCLLFYRNAFPYFFPFILAPAAVLAGVAVERIGLLSRHPLLLALGLVAPAALVAVSWSKHDQHAQRQLVAAVHRIFQRQVAYIDRNSMVGSFPKRGFFMSTWGMANYRKGMPVFAEVLSRDTVPLLIIDGPALEQAAGLMSGLPQGLQLYPQDVDLLRQNFIPHWGRIWVAGKRVEATPAGMPISIVVPGTYTVEGGAVKLDGKPVAAGGTVNLSRGRHLISSAAPAIVTLRWGDHLYKPVELPIAGPIYRGF
jgi:hypothetical protein